MTECGCITKRPVRAGRSSSCTNTPATIGAGNRRCGISASAIARSPTMRAAIRRRMCRRTWRSIRRRARPTTSRAVLDHLKIDKAHVVGPVDGRLRHAAFRLPPSLARVVAVRRRLWLRRGDAARRKNSEPRPRRSRRSSWTRAWRCSRRSMPTARRACSSRTRTRAASTSSGGCWRSTRRWARATRSWACSASGRRCTTWSIR